MYIRFKTNKGSKNPTVQVVESTREEGKVRQKIIASLGTVRSQEDRERFIKLGYALISKLKEETVGQLSFPVPSVKESVRKHKEDWVNPKDLVHVQNLSYGYQEV